MTEGVSMDTKSLLIGLHKRLFRHFSIQISKVNTRNYNVKVHEGKCFRTTENLNLNMSHNSNWKRWFDRIPRHFLDKLIYLWHVFRDMNVVIGPKWKLVKRSTVGWCRPMDMHIVNDPCCGTFSISINLKY